MLVPKLLTVGAAALGSSEIVQIERLRLIGVAISAIASTIAAVLAYRNAHEIRQAKREARLARRENRSKRHLTRSDDERVLVVDEAPCDPEELT